MSGLDFRRCPRCDAEGLVVPSPATDGEITGALSRATRDEGADVYVCSRCGSREAEREFRGQVIPLADWPMSIDKLLEEERWFIERGRASTIELRTIGPDEAAEMLGG